MRPSRAQPAFEAAALDRSAISATPQTRGGRVHHLRLVARWDCLAKEKNLGKKQRFSLIEDLFEKGYKRGECWGQVKKRRQGSAFSGRFLENLCEHRVARYREGVGHYACSDKRAYDWDY